MHIFGTLLKKNTQKVLNVHLLLNNLVRKIFLSLGLMDSPQNNNLGNQLTSTQFRNMHAPQKSSVMHFLEKIHYLVSTHKVINWIVSILYFALFILNSISRIFLTGRRLDSKFFKRDLIFYICGMRPEVLVPEDIVMALTICCISNIAIIIFCLFVFSLRKRYYPLFLNLFIIFWFYIIPIAMFVNTNVFMQGYALVDYISDQQTNQRYGFTSIILISMIVHFLMIFLISICLPAFTETPRDIVHPFISISRFQYVSLIPYYFIFMHISGFFFDFNLTRFTFRIIFAVTILIFHIYMPYYSNRIMNSLLMFALLVEIICTSVYVSMNDLDSTYNPLNYDSFDDNAFMDKRFMIILLLLPFLLAISFLFFFVLFPFLWKKDRLHQIKNQYISGELYKTMRLFKRLKFANIQHCNMKEILKAAIAIKYPQTNQIIQYLYKNNRYTQSFIDVYFLWTSVNIVDLEINNEISLPMLKMADKYETKIKDLEKEFWTNVYLSNISKLPKIASKLNTIYILRFINIDHSSKICPKLLKSEKVNYNVVRAIKKSRKIPKIKRFFNSFSLVDLFLLIVFIATVIGHSLFLATSKTRWNLVNNCVTFLKFTENFMDYEISLWGYYDENGTISLNINKTNANISLNILKKSFENLQNQRTKESTIKALLERSRNGETFNDQMVNFIQIMEKYFQTEAHFISSYTDDKVIIISDKFVDLIFTFDDLLTQMQDIFDEIVKTKTKYKTLYSFFAPILLLLIFIVFAFVNFIILKKKCRQFYKGFAIIRKTVLKTYETEASKGTYQFRRKHTFSYTSTYPAMTIAIVWAFLNVLIQLVLLEVNDNHDKDNSKLIYNAINGLCSLQSVPLWLVTSILFRNKTFNSISSGTIDLLSQSSQLKEYKYLIPDSVFTLYGDYIYKSNPKILFNEWNDAYVKIESNLKEKSESFDYLKGFFVRRFACFFCCSFIMFVFFLIIQNEINIFMKNESRIGEFILKNFAYNFDPKKREKNKSQLTASETLNSNTSNDLSFIIREEEEQNEKEMEKSDKKNKNDKKIKNKKKGEEDDDSQTELKKKRSNSRMKAFNDKKNSNFDDIGDNDEMKLEEIYYEEESQFEDIDNNDNNLISDQNLPLTIDNSQLKENKITKAKYWPFTIESFDQLSMPLHFIVTDRKLKVVFCTKSAHNKVGQTLRQGRLSTFLIKKMKELNKSCKIDEEIVWKMPDTNIQAIPMLKFNNSENKFEVNKLIVLEIEDSTVRIDHYQNEYNNLFRSVYPEFMKEATFPTQISTKQNYRMILIIKLNGFDNDFQSKIELDNDNNNQKKSVQNVLNLNLATIRIRRMISQSLIQKLDEYPFIYRIRETSSEIIITFDQENDKIAWNLFSFGTAIANSVFSDMKLLKSSLINKINVGSNNNSINDLPFSATALLYKAKVQDMFAADEKMGFVDFVGDCIYEAEKVLNFCIPFHLNYVSMIPRDPKPKFTTKIKSFTLYCGGNETKYDLYIGV